LQTPPAPDQRCHPKRPPVPAAPFRRRAASRPGGKHRPLVARVHQPPPRGVALLAGPGRLAIQVRILAFSRSVFSIAMTPRAARVTGRSRGPRPVVAVCEHRVARGSVRYLTAHDDPVGVITDEVTMGFPSGRMSETASWN